VLNASPESFSGDGGGSTRHLVERARTLVSEGADVIDVGGESARTDQPPLSAQQELGRVLPVIEGIRQELGVPVSIDSYKVEVVRAALRAGASIVNDISGLANPALAEQCAEHGARLVLVHNRGVPKTALLDPNLYDDVVEEVFSFMESRIAIAEAAGVPRTHLIVDPGPDLSKTPAQTVTVLRNIARLRELGCPLLLAVSRKDFIGAITGRPPTERLAGTLAAIEQGVLAGASMVRVHDVAAVKAFLTQMLALRADSPLPGRRSVSP
jgi:dihydropteroate synthase